MGFDVLGGPDQRSIVLPDLSVPSPLTEAVTGGSSEALVSSLGNSGVADAMSGSLGGVLEDLVRRQVESAGAFDNGLVDPLTSNTDVNKLLFGSESPMVAMAERAQELSAELAPPEEEQGETGSQAPTETVDGPQSGGAGDVMGALGGIVSGLTDAVGGDLGGALDQLAGGAGALDQLTQQARSILEQEGKSLFDEARAVLDGELGSLLESHGATDALHELGQLGDQYEDLLREQAGMFSELLAAEQGTESTEGAPTDPASTATTAPPTEGSSATATPDAGQTPAPELETLEGARDLLLQGMPELTQVFDGDVAEQGLSVLSGVLDGKLPGQGQ